MTQEELNRRFERRKNSKKVGIRVAVPDYIKKAKMLETMADNHKRDR